MESLLRTITAFYVAPLVAAAAGALYAHHGHRSMLVMFIWAIWINVMGYFLAAEDDRKKR